MLHITHSLTQKSWKDQLGKIWAKILMIIFFDEWINYINLKRKKEKRDSFGWVLLKEIPSISPKLNDSFKFKNIKKKKKLLFSSSKFMKPSIFLASLENFKKVLERLDLFYIFINKRYCQILLSRTKNYKKWLIVKNKYVL